jgi:dipeptidyl aminopeptidase/acylaminoacyl peptidase
LVQDNQSEGELTLEIVDTTGSVLREVSNVGKVVSAETPSVENIGRLSWSPDGSQVVVAPPSGGLLAVPRTGDPVEMVDPSRLPDPGTVVWSPRGDAIAFVAPVSPGTAGALYVATTAALPLDPIVVVPASINGRRTIDRVSWRPDGGALYYTVASTTNDPTFGGDLFEVSSGGGAPTLIATASRVGPVSAITNFAISADGNGVAYVVTVPQDDGGFTDSLWVQPIGVSEFLALRVPNDERVNDLWWTSGGLIWRSNPVEETASADTTISQAAPGGEPGIVYNGPAAGSDESTPVPVDDAAPHTEASPEALPQPSPATPIARSVASPEASAPDS